MDTKKIKSTILDALSNSPSKFRGFLEAVANLLDLFRVIPRAFMVVYLLILVDVVDWFKELPDPNGAQSAFISVVFGSLAGIFGLYVGKNREQKKIIEEEEPPLTDRRPVEQIPPDDN